MRRICVFKKDINGDAVVEATILFPIILMIFAALVMLAAYLPTRAALQRATQYAATALATEHSDVWLFYDISNMNYYWERDKDRLNSVYALSIRDSDDTSVRAERIVKGADMRLASLKEGDLEVKTVVNNRLIYNEIAVTAKRIFTPPINLSFIGFPETIDIVVTSTSVVHDGDEFVRNMDIVIDFADFISDKFGFSNAGEAVGSLGSRFKAMIGIR